MPHLVPQTILAQLGGRRFLAMTGARNLIGTSTMLAFMLPRMRHYVKEGITSVRITLTPMDTYTVEFLKHTTHAALMLHTCTDISAEDLQSCFTRITGLATQL